MAKNNNKYIDPSTKSITLGIVIGITITAVIVSSQAFLGLNEFNRNYGLAMDKLRAIFYTQGNNDSNEKVSDFSYAHTDEIKAVDTADWEVYRNEEFGFTLPYPSSWGLEVIGNNDCSKENVSEDCFMLVLSDDKEENENALMISTSSEMKQAQELKKFPVVLLLSGQEKIFNQYRKGQCTIIGVGDEQCTADPEGFLQFTNRSIDMDGRKLEIYILGNPSLELGAILNNLAY